MRHILIETMLLLYETLHIDWSDITLTCDLVTELDIIIDSTLFTKLREVTIEHF